VSKSLSPSPTLIIYGIWSYRYESQGNALSKSNLNNLIEAAVKGGVLDVATQLYVEAEQKGKLIFLRVFRFLMSALVASGDHKAIRALGECINEVSLKFYLNFIL
jgi:hypothetical protein